jgi:hypothetical protein
MVRIYLKQTRPFFKLYGSPVNIDPSQPALPRSTPTSYVSSLWRQMGFFYTQGIAEDTKALCDGVLSDGEYLQQACSVLNDQSKIF